MTTRGIHLRVEWIDEDKRKSGNGIRIYPPDWVDLGGEEDRLENMQKAVDGLIERLDLRTWAEGAAREWAIDLWANEEGAYSGVPPNPWARALAWPGTIFGSLLITRHDGKSGTISAVDGDMTIARALYSNLTTDPERPIEFVVRGMSRG